MSLFDIDVKEYDIRIQLVNNGYIVGVCENGRREMDKVHIAKNITEAIEMSRKFLEEQKDKAKEGMLTESSSKQD